MVKNMKHSTRRGAIALNIFAVAFALMPLFTMGIWTYQQFFSDPRRTVELAAVSSDADPQLFKEPLISVTFDDGWESIYSEAAPIMSELGVASTQYILPSQFPAPNYLSADQALSLRNAGHEISSHTYSHKNLTEIDEREVVRELDNSISILEKLQLSDDDYRTFAAPNGALNETSLRHVKNHFVLARNVNGDLASDISANDMNVKRNFDRYDVIGYTVGQYTTMDQLQESLAYAENHNAWFIPIYHQIDESGTKYSVTPAAFRAQLRLYRDSGIKIVTVRDVVMHNQEYMR